MSKSQLKRIASQANRWPPSGYTVQVLDNGKTRSFQAISLNSGWKGPLQPTYERALDDIQMVYAEPWGV